MIFSPNELTGQTYSKKPLVSTNVSKSYHEVYCESYHEGNTQKDKTIMNLYLEHT